MKYALAALYLTGVAAIAQDHPITPEQATHILADRDRVTGTFALTVRRTGVAEGKIFLDSEENYRSPRNLTVEIEPDAQQELAEHFGQPADRFFLNKAITVDGYAQRQRIIFQSDDGVPTGKYYFQAHVIVHDWKQVHLADVGQGEIAPPK